MDGFLAAVLRAGTSTGFGYGGKSGSLTKAQAFRIEKDLYRRFKAISNDQKIAGKKDEFEIDAGDKAFAELFRKPPDCKILEDLTYKCARRRCGDAPGRPGT